MRKNVYSQNKLKDHWICFSQHNSLVRTKNARYTMVSGWTKYGVRVHTVTPRVILTVPTMLCDRKLCPAREPRHTVIKATHNFGNCQKIYGAFNRCYNISHKFNSNCWVDLVECCLSILDPISWNYQRIDLWPQAASFFIDNIKEWVF